MKYLSVLLLILLSGCALIRPQPSTPPVVVEHKTLLAYTCSPPPSVDHFTGRNIKWHVISRDQFNTLLDQTVQNMKLDPKEVAAVKKAVGDFFFGAGQSVVWGLTTDDYSNLGRNTSDILAAVKQMRDVIGHYKNCIDDSQKAVAKQNAPSNTQDKPSK